ncbi:MAG: hypothetical protein GX957_10415 [Clostridiaceae bacterium]|nr:hypothetical protein [Clostridiaceae bacterium]
MILVQDKGRWSKDSTIQSHPPAVPWVGRTKQRWSEKTLYALIGGRKLYKVDKIRN